MKKKTLLQVFLLSLVLMILTLFYFSFFNQEENKIYPNRTEIKDVNEDEIKEVSYVSKDKKGNLYNITAKKAQINKGKTEFIKLDTVEAVYSLEKNNKVFLYSDLANYDVGNNITYFYDNIRIFYNNELIKCDELQLNLLENYMILKKNIIYDGIKIKIMADQLKIDLLNNTSIMKMFENGDKIKIIKKNVSNEIIQN